MDISSVKLISQNFIDGLLGDILPLSSNVQCTKEQSYDTKKSYKCSWSA